ncbi:sigma-70 family RNA polymerase sigma factor [Methylocystis sp. 9N]|uniref:Sigma-70 family RNA polymerase sigma factor n=1 Tax=Methylocystis borbori TaxID=3118750 RepID=A0ABU7XI10_9HYPH
MSARLLSNEALLQRVAAGDRGAFRDLYDATASRLYAICVALLKDSARAEEALQESFVRIWERANAYDEAKGAALAWMSVVTRRVALNELRRRDNAHRSLDEDGAAPEIAADLPELDPIGKGRLLECLDKLEAERRQWVLLAYVHGYSHEELARRFERPLGTMKSALFRGLAELRKCIS